MTMIATNHSATNYTPVSSRFSVLARIKQARALWQQRRVLKSLDAAALQDIGVTREQANAEADRPVWDAPRNWCD